MPAFERRRARSARVSPDLRFLGSCYVWCTLLGVVVRRSQRLLASAGKTSVVG